ncbi:MAG: hypothetical protein ACRCU5_05580 [Rhizobiaceae bacterium]
MDWPLAIEKNRERLLAVIVALITSLGILNGGRLTTLPHYLFHRALSILRPAEAALRRFIVIAAHQLDLSRLKPRKPSNTPVANFTFLPPRAADYVPAFQLIEPLKVFKEELPDFASFGASHDNTFGEMAEPSNRTPVLALQLGLRLLALKRALDHLPKQARRLARWYAARDLALQNNAPHRLSPMRPGLPPARHKRPRHAIEDILLDCHSLALLARDRRDSS